MKKIFVSAADLVIIPILISLTFLSLSCKKNNSILGDFTPVHFDEQDEVQKIQLRGPNNEKPASLSDIINLITTDDLKLLQKKKVKIALCMHDVNNDWSQALISGIKYTLNKCNIKLHVITDGEFDIEKQIADYENIIEMKPDLIITIPIDTKKTIKPLRKAVKRGIKLVFIDSVPEGFKYPEDYTGWAVGDAYMLGEASAEILANHLNQKGKVALLHWKHKMFTVDQRSLAAQKTFKKYPNITVVDELYFEGFYDIPRLMEKLLKKHPDLAGLWTVWDSPAFEAVKVIKKKGARVSVTTVDMSKNVALAIAKQDIIIGTGADHPYDQGVAQAILSLAAILNKNAPPFIVINAEKITLKTLRRAWKRVYHKKIPDDLNNILLSKKL